MKRIINAYVLGLFLCTAIINPVYAEENNKCAPDYDVSRIRSVPLDENAKYVFNETEIIVDAPIESVFHFTVYEPLENLLPARWAIASQPHCAPIFL